MIEADARRLKNYPGAGTYEPKDNSITRKGKNHF
jgi:hypothetical protein